MVDLSEAGVRLRDYRPEPTPSVGGIIRRRDRRRRRRRLAGGLAGLAIVAAIAVVVVAVVSPWDTGRRILTASGRGQSNLPAVASVTAAQLAAGRWSTMPVAPIAPRLEPSLVWTGIELIVWGGYSGADPTVLHSDGAAYNPSTNRWRVLPPAPLSARNGQTTVWTGSEMVVWGGHDQLEPLHVTSDGAAYDPADNKWKVLPPAPLSPRARALGVWTSKGVLILGGFPGVTTGFDNVVVDGALYNPATNRWHHIAAPSAPPDHGLGWTIAVNAGDEVVAWSHWTVAPISGANGVERAGSAGADMFAYNERSDQWRLVPPSGQLVQVVFQAVWTGQYLIVRGNGAYCLTCKVQSPEKTALYSPAHETWTGVPADPLELFHPLSVWTGAALLSVDVSGGSGITHPGDATAYDPATRQWVKVPSAPFGCDDLAPPFDAAVWTGQKVLLYCQSSPSTQQAGTAGLVFTPGG